MGNAYLWVKTFHIVLITSWFAGLFYLPRIFVNLADEKNIDAYARLIGMADRLFRFMTILAVPAVLLGLTLWLYFGVGAGDVDAALDDRRRDQHIGLAIDDIAPITHDPQALLALPFTMMKLDRHTVREAADCAPTRSFLRRNIDDGHAAGMTIVAEGI